MSDTLLFAIYYSLQGKKKPDDDGGDVKFTITEKLHFLKSSLISLILAIVFYYLTILAEDWNLWVHLILHIPLGLFAIATLGFFFAFIYFLFD